MNIFDPSNQIVFNVSKETTKKEICKIVNVNEYTARMQSINLSGGGTNAIEFCATMFNFPQLSDLLKSMNSEVSI